MTNAGYPFQFVGVSTDDADSYQVDTLIYRFHSRKSGHRYEVHIERYIEHLCCVKFFDLSVGQFRGRYSQTTDTFEPRTIFRTVANIALDALERDAASSFFFIGAADSRDDSGVNTRRFRVYQSYVNNLGMDDQFQKLFFNKYSMGILVNRSAVPDIDGYVSRIIDFIEMA